MKSNSFLKTVLFIAIIMTLPIMAFADYNPPTIFGAPKDIAVHYHETWNEEDWDGFDVTVNASKELRDFFDDVWAENSSFVDAGYYLSDMLLQLDYKADDGSWHYRPDWNDNLGYDTNKSIISIEKGTYSNCSVFSKSQFESISDGESITDKKSYFDNHSMDIRVRFVVCYQDNNGIYYRYASPWSQTASFSNNLKLEDPAALINNIPVLKSADIKKYSDGKPYLNIITNNAHKDIIHLNSISGNAVKTEVWLKVGSGEWKPCHTDSFVEEFNVGSEAYFGLKDSYDNAVYDIKYRYCFDYFSYPSAGKTGVIYGPFSNTISYGMPAYSNASNWAKSEIDKANEYGLIPASLKGADMTKPITREEFAEVSVLLYEKASGKESFPATPNPFKDTINLQILKAFNLGIVKGISDTAFAPKELTNREQVASMLSRAIRVIAPESNFSTMGSPVFIDQKDVSSWALEHVLYMSKLGIIKGADGKFMPKASTAAQIAAGYATTTREQAIAMSLRSYENIDIIKTSKPSTSN